uniref:Uncharacterized protein n=1 Tax=Romanomermis culicivorax TaxID=13658 RepID=A0A915INJ8_ROMCU
RGNWQHKNQDSAAQFYNLNFQPLGRCNQNQGGQDQGQDGEKIENRKGEFECTKLISQQLSQDMQTKRPSLESTQFSIDSNVNSLGQ